MKKIRKILVGLLIIVGLFYGLGVLFVNLYGKDYIDHTIHQITKKPVYIKKVAYGFPFGINLHQAEMIDRFKVSKISIQFHIDSILENKRHVASILMQDFHLSLPENFKLGKFKEALIIDRVYIRNGRLAITDKNDIKREKFSVSNMKVNISDLVFPLNDDVSFNFTSLLSSLNFPINNQDFSGGGWLNINKNDMDVTVQLKNVEDETILSANLRSQSNDMDVEGEILLKDLIGMTNIKEVDLADDQLKLNKLLSTDIDIIAKFSFNTKMNSFKVEKIIFEGDLETKSVDE